MIIQALKLSLPEFLLQTPPLGEKGAGEAGFVGALPCIQSALIEAISPLGLKDVSVPATLFRI